MGSIKVKKTLNLDELIDRYELSNRAEGKSIRTVGWYSEMLASFSSYSKGKDLPPGLGGFTTDSVRSYILYLRAKPKFKGHPYTPEQNEPVSPRTVQCHVRALKAFSTWLHNNGYTKDNRVKNLKLPKAPTTMMVPLAPEEIKQVLAVINKSSPTGFRNYAILGLSLDSGLRASEIANITMSHINLKDGFIKVMGKGAKERVVPIGKFVQMNLWRYLDHFRPNTSEGCDKLFLSRSGKPITVNTIKLVFSRLAKSSGVTRLHAHLCRHTFAINYLLNGGDIFSLREILGHTTFEMVNHYLHFTSSQITAQHHKYSPMDRFQSEKKELVSTSFR